MRFCAFLKTRIRPLEVVTTSISAYYPILIITDFFVCEKASTTEVGTPFAPRFQNSFQEPGHQGSKTLFLILAGNDQTVAGKEAVAEPAAAQNPAPAMPVGIPHVTVDKRVQPDFDGYEAELPHLHGNLILVTDDCFDVLQPRVRAKLPATLDHFLATKVRFSVLQELLQDKLELTIFSGLDLWFNQFPAGHVAFDGRSQCENQPQRLGHESNDFREQLLAVSQGCIEFLARPNLTTRHHHLVYQRVILPELAHDCLLAQPDTLLPRKYQV